MARNLFLPRLNGVFSVIKPRGVTSGDMSNRIRDLLREELGLESGVGRLKVGHGGILDNDATGVLAMAVGEGCRLLTALLHGNKEYKFVGQFGEATDTYDSSGEITETKPYDFVSLESLEKVLKTFHGETMQKPPLYSALKFQGKRLSDLTREGKPIPEIEARRVNIHELRCTHFDLPHFHLVVACGGGFYVRSLVHDIGQALGTCAHLVELERTKHGPFTKDHSLTEDQLHLDNILAAMQYSQSMLSDILVSSLRDVRKRKRDQKVQRRLQKQLTLQENET